MSVSKVTRNFQVTIPQDVRERFGVGIGDDLVFTEVDDALVISKADDILERAAGLWKGMKETGVEYENRLRKGWAHRRLP
ncbi:MAG: AbrB/MazE/SpoVT family DNA-binding domain-containing protein [Candidatus Woesearchaeota archaeon]|jgi:AbrB family looped-hinge helix DNA binding protein|nr:AbrB/MazE/SpoVT family DNA-binding domain-containing protein [Candidatus Woesearchaeota archaeon]MDP7182106.1 AbrB/MazE/SpoVT family DNA-binding domain-containing protein [Candidatus Woesearchaeota archaeon]MDP7198688.1 AbrB/MazE/SpoVT family DNA-binding domain-containing protein [Candidatus Woesearchaeota archaeon]MDP7467662.1 AbrB/MazE/SpoVT family DNA-binding domain-containing protein [Candidatus Woesearchaeota archaeon]MDP7647231.1 AbrB/MazE/SpoVT family DNA-binding domain-containing pro